MREAPLLDLIEARRAEAWAAAEAGMAMAADHAEAEDPGWKNAALNVLIQYARQRLGEAFMIEDVRDYADAIGLGKPPSARAWGAVTLRAKRAGLIVRAGFGNSTRGPAHMHPSAKWKAA